MSSNETLATHILHAPILSMLAKYTAAAVVFAVGLVVAMVARRLAKRSLLRTLPRDVESIVEKLIYYGIIAIATLSALSVAGVEATGLLVAGSIVGVAVGFASQTVVSNFLSGIFLYIDRPFKPGDPVDIEGVAAGTVRDITIFSTRIRTWDGVDTRIPNSRVFESVIRNFSRNVARRVEYRVGIAYDADIGKAVEVIRGVLDDHPLVLVEPEPMIFVEDLGDSAVILNVRFWVPSSHWLQAKAEVLRLIKEALDRAGIEIPFPQRVIWFRGEHRVRAILESSPRGEDCKGGVRDRS